MTIYTVRAKRWAKGWELHIDGVGVTQTHRLSGAVEMARDYIAIRTDTQPETIEVELVPEVGAGLDAAARRARDKVRKAEEAQRAAAADARTVARRLHEHGLTGRDISVVLQVSPQRVSQLLADHKPAKTA